MSRIHILLEGQTEETFVRDEIVPHLATRGVYANYTILKTKRVLDGPDYAGGIGTKTKGYKRFKNDAIKLLHDTDVAAVTTLIDFYGLPEDFPGRSTLPPGSPYERVKYVEEMIERDINNHRFIPFLALHEFEALLFSEPEKIDEMLPESNALEKLIEIRNQFNSPEEINDDPRTAPSKRLKQIFQGSYQKTLHGPIITSSIGLEKIRQECPHFDEWLKILENL